MYSSVTLFLFSPQSSTPLLDLCSCLQRCVQSRCCNGVAMESRYGDVSLPVPILAIINMLL